MEVSLDKAAYDALDKLPQRIAERILDKLERARSEPFHFFERLANSPLYKLRVGDYRVLVEIDEMIHIRYVGKREDIYK